MSTGRAMLRRAQVSACMRCMEYMRHTAVIVPIKRTFATMRGEFRTTNQMYDGTRTHPCQLDVAGNLSRWRRTRRPRDTVDKTKNIPYRMNSKMPEMMCAFSTLTMAEGRTSTRWCAEESGTLSYRAWVQSQKLLIAVSHHVECK